MSSLYADMQVVACTLMTPHRPKAERADDMPLDPTKLMGAAHTLCAFFDQVLALEPSVLERFSAVEWAHLTIAVILVLKLSFPVDTCPLFEAAQARSALQAGAYLEKLCADPPAQNDADKSKTASGRGAVRGKSSNNTQDVKTTTDKTGNNNIAAAFRIILRKVKAKFDRRVAAAEAKAAAEETRALHRCPFLDGSLTEYIPLWEGQTILGNYSSLSGSASSSSQYHWGGGTGNAFGAMGVDGAASQQQQPPSTATRLDMPVFHDLWATMTQSWAVDDSMPNLNLDSNDADNFGTF